jgi:BirA family biotin operon repressor/biotin-[acetyl-CoA-carboxylase] ligase
VTSSPRLFTREFSDSTQDEARALLAREEPDFGVLTCDQRRGRGRLDRRWSLPAGHGLALTVVHRTPLGPDERNWYPHVVGLGVLEALDQVLPAGEGEIEVGLKWPNDVLTAAGAKLGGILLETVDAPAIGAGEADGRGAGDPRDTVLVGIGLNLLGPVVDVDGRVLPDAAALGGPGGVRGGATEASAMPTPDLAPRLATALLALVAAELDLLDVHQGDAVASGQANRYGMTCLTIGRSVLIDPLGAGEGSFPAVAEGIDPQGRLVVRTEDGARRPLDVGDVRHARLGEP